MTKEQFLRMAYKTQAILVNLIKVRYMLNNSSIDTAIIRSVMDDAIKDIACAVKELAERGLFGTDDDATDTNVGGNEGKE